MSFWYLFETKGFRLEEHSEGGYLITDSDYNTIFVYKWEDLVGFCKKIIARDRRLKRIKEKEKDGK